MFVIDFATSCYNCCITSHLIKKEEIMLGLSVKDVLLGIVIAVMLGVLVMLSINFNVFAIRDSMKAMFFPPTTANVTTSRTIVNSMEPLGQLVSLRVELAQADINVTVNAGAMNLCGHSANHVAQGVIEAGVDITKITEDSVSYNELNDTYTITLPAPEITSCRIEYIRQYEQAGGNPTCGIDWDNVRLLGQYVSTQEFAQDALDSGLLERAERETTLLMQSFVGALTGSNVEIIYAESPAEAILPASCVPQLPNGWSFDETLNSWVQTP
jgi:hypothetical protein